MAELIAGVATSHVPAIGAAIDDLAVAQVKQVERHQRRLGIRGEDVDVDNLYVKSAIANDGPRMKRIRPAPMGRAYRYQRRMAHIVIKVAEKEQA